ncbi:hypothetical protein EZV62_008692 [Acer yangbiense]|uniref:HMA domain-containing protein n=1 Tax=Acer yangbiense TaxID=1000413 RepID=A0A5C7IDP3_9ROSI|nr:hypothetical protein EZV62_008692 [Acer yangbiense]
MEKMSKTKWSVYASTLLMLVILLFNANPSGATSLLKKTNNSAGYSSIHDDLSLEFLLGSEAAARVILIDVSVGEVTEIKRKARKIFMEVVPMQKIVIMLKLKCDKCRSKAMKIAAVADGVISVAWEGDEKNKVVMTGDGTDAATVTGLLRKKLGYADLKKIVIKVQVRCDKCRSKTMKIVAVAEGEIFSVSWEGECKDKLVVIGDGVDAATLTTKLDKKLDYAELLLVEEVKEKKVVPEKKEPEKVKKDPEPSTPQCCQPYCPCKQQLCTQPSYPFGYQLCGPVVVYEDPFTSTCSIM